MLRYAHRLKGLTCRASWAASPMVTPLLASTFHSSSVLSMGRKSGSKAMEFTVRPPSKKQMRKRRKLMEALALKRDPVKEKIRDQNIMNQIENMDVSSRVAELGQR